MTLEDLRADISVELQSLEATVREAVALRRDVGAREGTVRERTAANAFLAQFYGGVENILKRLCRFCAVALPSTRAVPTRSLEGLKGREALSAAGFGLSTKGTDRTRAARSFPRIGRPRHRRDPAARESDSLASCPGRARPHPRAGPPSSRMRRA